MDKKILITGATGKLGSKLVGRLGGKVVTWNRKIDGELPRISVAGTRKVGTAGVIVHLAGKLGMFDRDCYGVNVAGTRNILRLIDVNKKTKFIFVSSVDAEKPFSDYGKSKLAAEKEIKRYGRDNKNFDYLILRIGNVDFRRNLDNLARNELLRRMFGNYKLNLVGSDEVVDKIIKLVKLRTLGRKVEKFYGERMSANEIAGKKITGLGVMEGVIVWLMRKIHRGGWYLYLTYQSK